jgi:hypothetical protein
MQEVRGVKFSIQSDAGNDELHRQGMVRQGGNDEGVGQGTAKGRFVAPGQDVAANIHDANGRRLEVIGELDELAGEPHRAGSGVKEVQRGGKLTGKPREGGGGGRPSARGRRDSIVPSPDRLKPVEPRGVTRAGHGINQEAVPRERGDLGFV